jgi:hypothetical protein
MQPADEGDQRIEVRLPVKAFLAGNLTQGFPGNGRYSTAVMPGAAS